ncbi:ATP-grasp domain-containing protein [Frigidibacter oleivorans]|uniref:ATP-grasp domain-containing protein n=1 Tax=Frigidibacter oleivorans TaxID=2487129 RepID=UPI0013DF07C1|nr:ATP-grasp domain-containing protein [Frigidibacter oleivorans]
MTTGLLRVLLTSAGRRVELLNCFRAAADRLGQRLEVLACDLTPGLSAACAMADRAAPVPRATDPGYADAVLDLVRRHGIALVVPTIDPELAPLAAAHPAFADLGCRLHVSAPGVIDIARDKQRTAEVLGASGVPVPPTLPPEALRDDPAALPWPVFVKPRGGSASRGLAVIDRPEDLPPAFDEPMICQPRLSGPEFTVNLFVDAGGTLRCVIPHRRLQIRAGEVEKGRTERLPVLRAIAEGVAAALPGLRGAACFQVIEDAAQGPRVIEINARFGGGYPLADHAGATFAQWLLEEATGRPCTAHDAWRDGVEMLRYDAAVFRG